MTEVRVYYEVLEQAVHYIAPLVHAGVKAAGVDAQVILVRRVKEADPAHLPGGRLSAIYQFTTPDFLISLVREKVEIPLLIGELSESVHTEDHDFQRATGALAGAITRTVYLKIVGHKESEYDFGGKTDSNPLALVRAFSERLDYHGYFLSDWATKPGAPTLLRRNPTFLSCPAEGSAPLAEFVIQNVVKSALKSDGDPGDPLSRFLSDCQGSPEIRGFLERVKAAPSAEEMFTEFASRTPRNGWRRYEFKGGRFILVFYRFSHGADPDRGLLTALSPICPGSEVLVRYRLKQSVGSLEELYSVFVEQAASEGLSVGLRSALEKSLHGIAKETVDVTDELAKMRGSIRSNKVLLTLILFSDGLLVHSSDNKIQAEVRWDRTRITGLDRHDLLGSLTRIFGGDALSRPLLLVQKSNRLGEDEVTYVLLHQILRPNGFRIVSVSYSGAQGDTAILTDREGGRGQPRQYVDVIAWLPRRAAQPEEELSLNEAKESIAGVEKDIAKLVELRRDSRALLVALNRLGEHEPRRIVIGVAFGADGALTTWKPDEVDYIVRILGGARWEIAAFGDLGDEIFRNRQGTIALPSRFEVADDQSGRVSPLS